VTNPFSAQGNPVKNKKKKEKKKKTTEGISTTKRKTRSRGATEQRVQGYLAHKKPHAPRTLQEDYA
jgi:hypothetical protein